MGITLLPRLGVPAGGMNESPRKIALKKGAIQKHAGDTGLRYLPVTDAQGQPPSRRIVLAWRRSFTRYEAIAALRNAVYACELAGVTRLTA
jgi:LysR family transcriptional regulator, hydrogen peroxide-inducible genes activator